MILEDKLWIGQSEYGSLCIDPAMANRHGLITGATGTGKTTTVKVLAEAFSAMGVPVFMQDVKGDFSGISVEGEATDKISERLVGMGLDPAVWTPDAYPTRFWDIFGEEGHPIRVTISDMGPAMLGRLLNLSDVQTGVLNLVFRIADEQGLLLLDLKDLRLMLSYCADHRTEFTTDYGTMSAASIGVIQRALLTLEEQGGDIFFGEPELHIQDLMMVDEETGKGYINILSAKKLINSPLLYSTFLLWMLSELFEELPEEGDLPFPKMVFFFDEAHLIFKDASKALLDKITQIVKLIRSKGIGLYFISQAPGDIPDSVQGQLQNRIQHALHAYTPAEQKSVKIAAETFRPNPDFKTEDAICNLGVGEALISFLDEKGVPGVVEIAKILPPQSSMKPASAEQIAEIIAASELEELYREAIDRESAYEILSAEREAEEAQQAYEEEMAEAKKAEKRQQQLEAAEQRRLEREAAALERARRKEDAERARAYAQTYNTPASRSRSYSSYGRRTATTGRTTASRSYTLSSRNTTPAYDPYYDHMPPAPTPVEGPLEQLGRTIDRSVNRGMMGNRRYR